MPNGNISINNLVDNGLSVDLLKGLKIDPDVIHSPILDRRTNLDDTTNPDVISKEGPIESTVLVDVIHRVSARLKFKPDLANYRDALAGVRSPAKLAELMIEAKHNQLVNKDFDPLGAETGTLQKLPDKEGYLQAYKTGAIVWHPRHGAHCFWGDIYNKYKNTRAAAIQLGYPVEDQQKGQAPHQQGEYVIFEKGSIFQQAEFGIHLVTGAIWRKYLSLGAESSILGYPISASRTVAGRKAYIQSFQSGFISWSPATGAHEVHGLIAGLWQKMGTGEASGIGLPLCDERIPDRNAGFSMPERKKKPIKLPADIIKLPVEALNLDYPYSAINIPTERESSNTEMAAPATRTISSLREQPTIRLSVNKATLERSGLDISNRFTAITNPSPGDRVAAGATVLNSKTIKLDKNLLTRIGYRIPTDRIIDVIPSAVKTSPNRYSDFENGVLFWRRGAEDAEALEATKQASDGTLLELHGQNVASRISTTEIGVALRNAKKDSFNMTLQFAGVSNYSFDGTGTHNRRYKLKAMITYYKKGLFGIKIPDTKLVSIEVEMFYDPMNHDVKAQLTRWYGLSGKRAHRKLDALLWKPIEIFDLRTLLPENRAVLSVKTLENGKLQIYTEPSNDPVMRIAGNKMLAFK